MRDEDGQHADRIGVSPEGSSAETRSGAEVPRGGPVEDDRPDPRPSTGGVAPRRLLIAATHEDLSEHLEAIKERISARSRDGTAIELAEVLDGDAPDDASGQIGVAGADIFMAIVAWRYGAIPPEHDRSIIQSAYEEVVRQGKPRLIFLAAPGTEYQTDAQALFPTVVRDEQNLRSLQILRAQLQRERGVAYFTTCASKRAALCLPHGRIRQSGPIWHARGGVAKKGSAIMVGVKTARASYGGGMRFTAESGSGHQLVMDTSVDEGGQNAGFSPMELPIIALAGCMGMDVISILRKQRQEVTGYDIAVRGTRAEEHPKVFVAIAVEHTFTGRGLKPEAVARAVELSRTRYCSVSAMLNKSAEITHTIQLVEAGPDAPSSAQP